MLKFVTNHVENCRDIHAHARLHPLAYTILCPNPSATAQWKGDRSLCDLREDAGKMFLATVPRNVHSFSTVRLFEWETDHQDVTCDLLELRGHNHRP